MPWHNAARSALRLLVLLLFCGIAASSSDNSNGDGSITRADARFDELRLWGDVDADRVGGGSELQSPGDRGVERVDLDFPANPPCAARGRAGATITRTLALPNSD